MKTYAISDVLEGKDVKRIRNELGLTQAELAALMNTTQKTIERWEGSAHSIKGPVVTLIKILTENMEIERQLRIPEKKMPMRLWYMFQNEICAVIDVDEQNRNVNVHNYTKDFLKRPFGRKEFPDFEEYETFLESRCFPRSRDKMKLMLRKLDLPFYEPLMIIEKTDGRMAEDNFWIKIER